ncbi:MAG: hypothetical protein ACO29O_03115 [Chitinophagaceae bacterium]
MPVDSSIFNVISTPWMLIAPSIPLLLILILKVKFDSPMISILIYCIVSFLTRSFTLINEEFTVNQQQLLFLPALDFLFSFIILFNCIDQKNLKYPSITALLVYSGMAFSFLKLSKDLNELYFITQTGMVLNFLFSTVVLASFLLRSYKNLIQYANFWFVSGMFIYYGVMQLLMFSPDELNESEISQFKYIYAVAYFLLFMMITIGLIMHNKVDLKILSADSDKKKYVPKKFSGKNLNTKDKNVVKPYSSKKW